MILGQDYTGTPLKDTLNSHSCIIESITLNNASFENIRFFVGDSTEDGVMVFESDYQNSKILKEDDLAGNVNLYIIKRRQLPNKKFEKLAEIDKSAINLDENGYYVGFIDTTVKPGIEYEYAYSTVIDGIESIYTSKSIKSKFDGLSISGLNDNGEMVTYYTILEAKMTETINNSMTIINSPFNRYPYSFKVGEERYSTGSVSGLFHKENDNCEYNLTDVYVKAQDIYKFFANGLPKIIKYMDGKCKLVVIGNEITISNDEHYEKVIVSFNYTEIGDVENMQDLIDAGILKEMYTEPCKIIIKYDEYGNILLEDGSRLITENGTRIVME